MTTVTNNLPARLILEKENATLQSLITELPEKARIGLMLPVRRVGKKETDNSGFLSTPLPKRQKSPIGDIIRRWGAKQNNVKEEEDSKFGIKEEVIFKEEELEEGFRDIDSLPEVGDVQADQAKTIDLGEGNTQVKKNNGRCKRKQ